MRILLDENVAKDIGRYLTSLGHKISRAQEVGLSGFRNGIVYRKAKEFDLFITNDKDFLMTAQFKPTEMMGVIFLKMGRAKPAEQVDAFENLLADLTIESLIGKLSILTPIGLGHK